jgi:DNA polymerase
MITNAAQNLQKTAAHGKHLRAFRDYETRSTLDLKKVGAHTYAEHSTTSLLCAVWIIEYADWSLSAPIVWRRGDGNMPAEVRRCIEYGYTVVGHNAAFEAAIDAHLTGPRMGWAVPKPDRLDCTLARAAVQGLPLDLDRLGDALFLGVRKDKAGHNLMLRMCKPRRPRKGEDPDKAPYWVEDAESLRRLVDYCIVDVRCEIEVDRALRPLQDQERPIWLLDQRMNNRGVEIDLAFVRTAEALVARALARANNRMCVITGGAVGKVTETAKLKKFAESHGVVFKTVEKQRRNGETYDADLADKEALQDLLDDTALDLHPLVRAAFELRLEAGKASLAKLARFAAQAPHGRARGNLQYNGAAPGRWAGRGIQLQNLVRRGVSEPGGWEAAFRDMRDLDDAAFELMWGSPFDVVSRMMRGAVIAAPGKQLYFADFSQVEARGSVWAAGQKDMLRLFANNGPIYEEMGATIFGISAEEVAEGHRTGKNTLPRWCGKTATLGCSYGLGWRGFQRTAKKTAGLTLPDELCERTVSVWRERNIKVVELWSALEDAAKRALRHPGAAYHAGPFSYRATSDHRWLQCKLPSGRLIWYRRPSMKPAAVDIEKYAPEPVPDYRWKLHYWGVNGYTRQWEEESTWGGKLLENCIQGMCADFLRHALIGLETMQYWPVLSVHDEPISEVDEGFGSVEEFVAIVSRVPSWARGFPLHAVGGTGTRYAKT